MPSLTATGWRVKWGPQCCTCNFTYVRLVSAQKSKKLSASLVTRHSPHNLYPSTMLSSFRWRRLCVSVHLSPERPRYPDRTLEVGSLGGLTDVYLRAAWLAHLGEGIWVTRGPGLQKPPWGSPRSKRTLDVGGRERATAATNVQNSRPGSGGETLNSRLDKAGLDSRPRLVWH